jgi:hypothetical protein
MVRRLAIGMSGIIERPVACRMIDFGLSSDSTRSLRTEHAFATNT